MQLPAGRCCCSYIRRVFCRCAFSPAGRPWELARVCFVLLPRGTRDEQRAPARCIYRTALFLRRFFILVSFFFFFSFFARPLQPNDTRKDTLQAASCYLRVMDSGLSCECIYPKRPRYASTRANQVLIRQICEWTVNRNNYYSHCN